MQSCRGGPALNRWLLSAGVPVLVLEPGHLPFIWAFAPRCLLRGPHQSNREGTSLPRPICRSGEWCLPLPITTCLGHGVDTDRQGSLLL